MQKSLWKFAVLAGFLGVGFFGVWQAKDRLGLSLGTDTEAVSLDDFVDEVPTDSSDAPSLGNADEPPANVLNTNYEPEGDPAFGGNANQFEPNNFAANSGQTEPQMGDAQADPFSFANTETGTSTVETAADPFEAFPSTATEETPAYVVDDGTSEAFDPFAAATENMETLEKATDVNSITQTGAEFSENPPSLTPTNLTTTASESIESDPFFFGDEKVDEQPPALTTTSTTTETTTEEVITIKKMERPKANPSGSFPGMPAEEMESVDLLFTGNNSTETTTVESGNESTETDLVPIAETDEPPRLLLPDVNRNERDVVVEPRTESNDAATLMVIEAPEGSIGRFPTLHAPNTTEPAPIQFRTDLIPPNAEEAPKTETATFPVLEPEPTLIEAAETAQPLLTDFDETKTTSGAFPSINQQTTTTTTSTVTRETSEETQIKAGMFPTTDRTPVTQAFPEVKSAAKPEPASMFTSEEKSVSTAIAESDRIDTSVVTPVNRELAGDGVVRTGVPRIVNKPEITLEKKAPKTAVLGQPMVYSIVVKNIGSIAAKEVTIEDRIPLGSKLTGTIPRAQLAEKKLIWKFSTLEPNAEKTIKVRVIPTAEGDIGSVTTVAFKTEVAAETQVTSPRLELNMMAPVQVIAGEEVAVSFRISNNGAGDAMNVILHSVLPKQLKHPAGNDLEYEIGTLLAGQTRDVTLRVIAEQPGKVEGQASVRASGGITASDEVKIDIIETVFKLTRTGPARRFVGMNGDYSIMVQNESLRDVGNVSLLEKVPSGMEFVRATGGGEFNPTTRTVKWNLATLKKKSKEVVQLTLKPTTVGTHTSQVEVLDGKGHKAELAANTKVEGFASLRVDISEGKGLVKTGERLSLRFSIRNRGSAKASNVVFQCKIPQGLSFVKANGGTEYEFSAKDNLVTFKPVATLSANQALTYDLVMSATKATETKLKIAVGADEMSEPLAHDEHVVIYDGDE